MAALGLKSEADFERARTTLPQLSGRWRWIVTAQEAGMLFTEELPAPVEALALSVSPVRVGSATGMRDSRRSVIFRMRRLGKRRRRPRSSSSTKRTRWQARRGPIFSGGEGRSSITPAHEAGCRCGVVRGFVLDHQKAEAGHFPLNHLLEADEIFVTNSIRGIVSVNNVQGRLIKDFTSGGETARGLCGGRRGATQGVRLHVVAFLLLPTQKLRHPERRRTVGLLFQLRKVEPSRRTF